jgi:hypothetical protein
MSLSNVPSGKGRIYAAFFSTPKAKGLVNAIYIPSEKPVVSIEQRQEGPGEIATSLCILKHVHPQKNKKSGRPNCINWLHSNPAAEFC